MTTKVYLGAGDGRVYLEDRKCTNGGETLRWEKTISVSNMLILLSWVRLASVKMPYIALSNV